MDDEKKSNSPALDAEQAYKTDVEKAEDYVENFDILETITNVGNDEVFTPVKTCKAKLDSLPADVWNHPEYKWLNPATKNGVFEREIAIRLNESPAIIAAYPDELERKKHILTEMIYALGETKFTARVARRTLYYCDDATRKCDGIRDPNDGHFINGFAIGNGTWFDRPEGNILDPVKEHAFGLDHKCKYCGIGSNSKYNDPAQIEHYAYDFIHMTAGELQAYFRENFFKGDRNMHFDIIIGNPPYQVNTNSTGQAIPIYQKFVAQALSLKPKYLSMIIPSKWFAGGMQTLESFRTQMMNDKHLSLMVDYANAKECFPTNSVGGGVCYFVWDVNHNGKCKFVNVQNGKTESDLRSLDEFPVLVRYNKAVSILRKIKSFKEKTLGDLCSPLMPFGLASNIRGQSEKSESNPIALFASDGVTYIKESDIKKGYDLLKDWKVLIGILGAEHALEPDKDGQFRIITSSMRVIGPDEACTHSYFTVGNFKTKQEADSLYSYLSTKFVRFLILLSMSSTHLSKAVFTFVPTQSFTEDWTDEKLYEKYGLSSDETDLIESMIKPMPITPLGGGFRNV